MSSSYFLSGIILLELKTNLSFIVPGTALNLGSKGKMHMFGILYLSLQRSLSTKTKYKLNCSRFCLPSFAGSGSGSKCSRSSQDAFNSSSICLWLCLGYINYTEHSYKVNLWPLEGVLHQGFACML